MIFTIIASAQGIPILSSYSQSDLKHKMIQKSLKQFISFDEKVKLCRHLLLNKGLWVESACQTFTFSINGAEFAILEAEYDNHTLFLIGRFGLSESLVSTMNLSYLRIRVNECRSHFISILDSIDEYLSRIVDGGTFLDSIGDSSQLEDIIMEPSWQDFVNEFESRILRPYLEAYTELIIEPTSATWYPSNLTIGAIFLVESVGGIKRWSIFHNDRAVVDKRLNINHLLLTLPCCSVTHFVECTWNYFYLVIAQPNVACIFVTTNKSFFSEELGSIVLKKPEGDFYTIEEPLERFVQQDVAAGSAQYLSFLNDRIVN